MSTVPKLSRWSTFVRSLGGVVGLDIAWEQRAWADFSDGRDGPLDVVALLGRDGDIDVTVRPRLEGQDIRKHRHYQKALAALAYVNPATQGDGGRVSRDKHRGDWYQVTEDLAVAVAGGSGVGGVDVGGRGAYLVYKDRLWLPNGTQTPREWPDAANGVEQQDEVVEPADESLRANTAAVAESPEHAAADSPKIVPARQVADNTVPFPSRRTEASRPKEPRSRIFGDETDALIQQSRNRRRLA